MTDEITRKIRAIKFRYSNEAINEIIGVLELITEALHELSTDTRIKQDQVNEDLKNLDEKLDKVRQ